MLTPLPGSKDHLDMVRDGVEIDPDLNRYDSIHETFKHPGFDAGGWQQTYRDAWLRFYSVENIVDILLRGPREQYWPLFWFSMWYRYAALAGEHPMFTGLGRLKGRRDRRAGMPRENVFRYLWRRTSDWYQLARTYGRMFFELQEIWMLTREPEDPRWATLAELRARWERVQTTLAQADMRDSYDALAYHLRDILSSASIELRELSGRRRLVSRRVSHRLRELAHEAETRLRRLDVRVPSAEELESIRRFAAERVVKGYEELAIGHVRRRRKFNKLRRDLVTALKRGTFWRLNWLQMPKALVFEVFVGFRFTVAFMRRARKRVRLESRSGEAS
jgi:hypothetical protein